jgi:hypothetical protein
MRLEASRLGREREAEMSDKSFDPKIYPLNIVGFVIMVADLIALGYWSFAIWKPRAMALIAAGKWTWWDEVMEKLILIGFWVIAYMGYTIGALPDNKWDWKRAAQSGLEAVISGAIIGALYALMSRR